MGLVTSGIWSAINILSLTGHGKQGNFPDF
jgi:hypothetical protein